jgi:hypothetical protein
MGGVITPPLCMPSWRVKEKLHTTVEAACKEPFCDKSYILYLHIHNDVTVNTITNTLLFTRQIASSYLIFKTCNTNAKALKLKAALYSKICFFLHKITADRELES